MDVISDCAPVPSSFEEAVTSLRALLRSRGRLTELTKEEFLTGWGAVSYVAPGLHPDEFNNPEGGWPVGWRCLAAEAFRRCDLGELDDGELYAYPCAQRAIGMPWRPMSDGNLGY